MTALSEPSIQLDTMNAPLFAAVFSDDNGGHVTLTGEHAELRALLSRLADEINAGPGNAPPLRAPDPTPGRASFDVATLEADVGWVAGPLRPVLQLRDRTGGWAYVTGRHDLLADRLHGLALLMAPTAA